MSTTENVCALTGASGYVGSILCAALSGQNPIVELSRSPRSSADIRWSLESTEDISAALRERGVKTLIHAAWDMRASTYHQMVIGSVQGSLRLFDAARRAGVENIIFISTISAFAGARSAYGRSKLDVEKALHENHSSVFRLGLVFGDQPGGVFGGLRKQVQKGGMVPLIGTGAITQYMLHEETLSATMLRAVAGEFRLLGGKPITLAHSHPWPFRELLLNLARAENRTIRLLPIPWQLLYAGLRMGEAVGAKLPFRSDSVISFVYSDKNPDFSLLRTLGIDPRPYNP